MPRMEVHIAQDGQNMIVTMSGTGDMEAARSLQQQLMPVVKRKSSLVILDMAQVSYLTSMVLGILFWLGGQLRSQKRPLRLAGMNEQVAKVLETARADRAVEVYHSVGEALIAPTATAPKD